MVRGRLESSSLALSSSNSQRRLRVFLAGGGTEGQGDFAGGGVVEEAARSRWDGDAWRCRRGGGVHISGSVWALVDQVAGLPRLR